MNKNISSDQKNRDPEQVLSDSVTEPASSLEQALAKESVTGPASLDSVLSRAFHILKAAGRQLTAETMWIENLYINPECAELFPDTESYLDFVSTVTRDRLNVSLPDQPDPFIDLAEDCSDLCRLTANSSYDRKMWVSDISKLFENLKTPYYGLYAAILKRFRMHFTDQAICDQCLADYYSVIIKSSPEKLDLIDRLADQVRVYVCYPFLSQSLIQDILTHHLGLFALDKSGWLDYLSSRMPAVETDPSDGSKLKESSFSHFLLSGEGKLLEDFLAREKDFLDMCRARINPADPNPQTKSPYLLDREDDISGYLTALSLWMTRKDLLPDLDSQNQNSLKQSSLDLDKQNQNNLDQNIQIQSSLDLDSQSQNKSGQTRKILRRPGRGQTSRTSPSAFLDQYAYNMNLRKYISNPAIGRDQELADLELILISPKKSPILIGEAGVGKTSIVEGLAYQMQRGDIPELLGGKIIYKLTTTSLLSGTKYVGEMEERMKALTDELIRHPEILLFIDEIHTIVGAGSTVSSHNDISNMLKPFIDRGDIKIIGATTREEYEHFLLPDRALARRFYPIQVEEPDQAMTMEILLGTIPAIEHETRVHSQLPDQEMRQLLEGLIRLSAPENQPENQQTRLPELPLSILEMAYSYAALHRRSFLEKEDFIRAVRHSNRLSKEARAAYRGI